MASLLLAILHNQNFTYNVHKKHNYYYQSSWRTPPGTRDNKSYKKQQTKIKNNGSYLCFSGKNLWIKLFNQSSSNTNVSACKTLNLRTFLMVDNTSYDTYNHFIKMLETRLNFTCLKSSRKRLFQKHIFNDDH